MWSQPYDLNIYNAHTGAGVTRDRPSYKQGLYYAMYYGTGHWVREGFKNSSSIDKWSNPSSFTPPTH